MIYRSLKSSGPIEQNQPRFNNKASLQDEPRGPKFKHEKGSASQGGKPSCTTCVKRNYSKCLMGIGSFFGCGKDGNKVWNYPSIA